MRGIIYDGQAARVVDTLDVRAPGPRDVIVRIVAAGVCHSDVSVVDGTIPWPTPNVMGHEGAGIVEEVGSAVTHVKPGDHCVIATLAACGHCAACWDGRPTQCRQTMGNMAQPFTLDGAPAWNFAGASVFIERTVVRDSQVVPIPDDVPLTSACLVGCGVVTGAGAVLNKANVQLGQTAVVFGVGGVGLNVIQALRVKRAERIIAVDTLASKEPLARQFGATDFIDGSRDDLVEAIRSIAPFSAEAHAGPFNAGGINWAFDCVGHPAVTRTAVEVLDWGGTCVVIGVPAPTVEMTIPYTRITHVERTIVGCRYGSISPMRDIPLLIELYRRGEFLLDELVSAVHPLNEFDQVVHAMHAGELARGVLTF